MSKYLKNKNKKSLTLIVSLILIITIGVGGTLAYLITSTSAVKNTFTPSKVVISVDETFDGNTKEDVVIQNHRDSVKAYIRAAIVVNWMDNHGNVWATTPELGKDYTMTPGTGWTLGTDGIYYHKGAVPAGKPTEVLITEAKPLVEAPADGYYLSIEILAQGIQADGVDSNNEPPVLSAWESGVSAANNDTLTIKQ